MQPLSSRPVLVTETYRVLLEAIADGRLAPGARLTQEDLAALLQVSRQPVSHALALLKQEGFAVEAGRRGLLVAPLDPAYVEALYQVRAALDATAAGLAAQRAKARLPGTDRGLAALNAAVQDGRKAVAFADRTQLARSDMAFHQALNALSGNPVIVETAERQWGHFRRAMGVVLEDRAQYLVIWQEHEAIADAVAVGEAERATRLARGHAERASHETAKRLRVLAPASAAE